MSLLLNCFSRFLFEAREKEDGDGEISLSGSTTVELHLISRSKTLSCRERDGAFNDHSASKVSDVRLDCLPHRRQGSHLINSNAPHKLQTLEHKSRKGETGKKHRHMERERVSPRMLLLCVKAGRQMGAVRRRLDGGGRAGTGV